jgi:integrase
MTDPSRIRFSGPLRAYAAGFASELLRQGYTPKTAGLQVYLMAQLAGLRGADVHLGIGAHVSCLGKGRKQRITPLTAATVAVLRVWLAERAGQAAEPLFATRTGRALSRDALEHRLAKYVASAARTCPSLRQKKITCTCSVTIYLS